MKILGLSFVRNAQERLPAALDSMAVYCDQICVVDDRSTDRTGDILWAHPAVSNVFTVDPELSDTPWYIPESALLSMLYSMADLCQPDWVVLLSADETIIPAVQVRALLSGADEIAGFQMHLVSAWNDERYPFMVPLMGQARSQAGPYLALPPRTRFQRKATPQQLFPGQHYRFRSSRVSERFRDRPCRLVDTR